MWIFFSIFAVLGLTSRNLLTKVGLGKVNEYILLFFTVFGALLVGVVLVLINGIEISDSSFWRIFLIRVFLDTVAAITLFKALKSKAVSYVVPLTAITPIFTIISGYFINGDSISSTGLLGISIIVLGSIFVVVSEIDKKKGKRGLEELVLPTLLIMVTTISWGILDAVHKEGIEVSSPYTYFFLGNLAYVIIFFFLSFLFARKDFEVLKDKKLLSINLSLGFLLSIEFLSQLFALQDGIAAYVSAIKSLNIVFTTILAFLFLKEGKSGNRFMKLIGVAISFLGALLLIWSNF